MRAKPFYTFFLRSACLLCDFILLIDDKPRTLLNCADDETPINGVRVDGLTVMMTLPGFYR